MDAELTGNCGESDAASPVRSASAPDVAWALRAAVTADIEVVAELRATVMRADLERLGRYDEHRVRQRLRDSFSVRHTSIITVEGELAGCVTVRPARGRHWLEHFYLAPHCQSRGLGSAVLRTVLERTDAQGMTVALNVLQGSAARRLYERHGFVVEAEDPVDVFMARPPDRSDRVEQDNADGGAGGGPEAVRKINSAANMVADLPTRV
ncbi:GNAT family N-acetyltransferase [Streptomyces sp. NBC_00078]|uniref:GNAT family N-acetyltransferase n=1 Tax=unclassified Streptomyces TaxID=2593676 RepID=UPI002B1E6382|nr:GNAT family N-acetyltransferase [Streptomyces sp. NBC_00078]